jgi:hypothetical protein
MARRRIGQADCIARPEPRAASSLSELGALLDWTGIDGTLAGISAAVKGEPGWPPLALFRALLLATWHDLSDVRLAEALDDRASFRRFCGFAAHEPAPERTAFVRVRRELVRRGLNRAPFEAVTRRLEAKGGAVRCGPASWAAAPRRSHASTRIRPPSSACDAALRRSSEPGSGPTACTACGGSAWPRRGCRSVLRRWSTTSGERPPCCTPWRLDAGGLCPRHVSPDIPPGLPIPSREGSIPVPLAAPVGLLPTILCSVSGRIQAQVPPAFACLP